MIRVLVVDDEAPARQKVLGLLASEPDVEVVGEACDGEAAVLAIRRALPDLVLLDIQMPRLDGFGVIDTIGVEAMPAVVFITAYDEHALRAFEVQALDYLLKPFAPTRFRQVLDRVRRQVAARSLSSAAVPPTDIAQRIERLLDTVRPQPRFARHFLVERGHDREVLLPADAIDLIAADRNYLRFFAAGVEYLRRGVMNDIEQKLDPGKFLRLNRSEIVRLDAVAEFQPWFHGDYHVKMKDGTTLTWSRRYRARARLE